MVWMKWFRNCNGHSRLARFFKFTTRHTHRDFKHLPTLDCQRTHHQTHRAPTMYPLRKGQHWQKETSNRTITEWTGESAHWGACFTGCVLVQTAAEHLDIFPTSSLLPPEHKMKKEHNIYWQKASLQSHSVTCPTISRFITLAMVQVTVWEQLHTCI